MPNLDYCHDVPGPDPARGPPIFKRLTTDPDLLILEQRLRAINCWEASVTQYWYRLAQFGTAPTRLKAKAHLQQILSDYAVALMRSGDPYMPYATAEQISNGGCGVHILDQVGNGIPFFASEYSYNLLWLVLGQQGGGKSSALYYQASQLHVPLLALDPKGTWEYRAAQLGAVVVPPAYLRFDLAFSEDLLPLYLHAVAEGIALCTGLQYGLSCLYETIDVASAQLQRYAGQTGEGTSLCLKDLQQAIFLCDTRNPKRAQYFEAARTALDLLVGKNELFSTRSGLPLDALFAGRYIIPCWHLSTVQCRFLAWFLLNNLQFRSLHLPETTELKSLILVDDASRFISRPDSVFGSGSHTSAYLHLLSILRSTGRGCIFVDQTVEPICDDVKQLCNNWLIVGGIRGAKNQAEVAGAISLSKEQAAMLGKLKSREAVCFCPTTYTKAIHGTIPEVPPPAGRVL
jgi:hypothetical protein